MRTSFLSRGRGVLGGFLLCLLLATFDLTADQTTCPVESSRLTENVEKSFERLHAPEGKARLLFFANPGGHCFDLSAPMKGLIERGTTIQARLLPELKDP